MFICKFYNKANDGNVNHRLTLGVLASATDAMESHHRPEN